jgi:hypothetical protein
MELSPAEAQLASIRAEIQRYGQSIVPCDQLLVLVPPNESIKTAERERWSFEFRTDGTVRFTDLECPTGVAVRWPEDDAANAAKG